MTAVYTARPLPQLELSVGIKYSFCQALADLSSAEWMGVWREAIVPCEDGTKDAQMRQL